MAIFDPIRTSEIVDFLVQFMESCAASSDTPIGNYGLSDVYSCVDLYLVGQAHRTAKFLERAILWIDQAVKEKEGDWFGGAPNFHHACLLQAKAIAYWMLHGDNSQTDWQRAMDFQLAARDTDKDKAYPAHHIATAWLDDFMAYAFQAGQYGLGIAEYEKYSAGKTFTLSRALRPKDFAYALCLHRDRGMFEVKDLKVVGERILRSNLQSSWLGMGQGRNAAMWLKVVYADLLGMNDVGQIFYKAYDNMPKVVKPDWVQ